MFISLRKNSVLIKMINMMLVDLPSPSSLTYFWNFGSLLGIFLFIQILTGLFLSMHFSGSVILSFDSVIYMMRDVNYGWLLRVIHANGASFFFLCMYLHVGRGLYYGSFRNLSVWMVGVTILLLSMVTAFLGYVLPWGQMSFWAATVITNLLSVVPYFGVSLVEWMWGGFSVGNATLVRFFSFHFILPMIILMFVVIHIMFLHQEGSGNPLGMNSNFDKISFYPYFVLKDIYGGVFFIGLFFIICLIYPFMFMDSENFIQSNPMVTPVHIQPEWYFLFAYSILRSISSKIGGVIALIMSIMIFYFLPFYLNFRFRSVMFYPLMKIVFWYYVVNWMILTWIGACEVESPYIELGIFFSFMYFFMYIMFWMVMNLQDIILWFY